MRKTLYIIRHASAEDAGNSSMFRDFDRELTSTGIIEAARMGKYLDQKGIKFDHVISSSAERAKATAKIFCEQLGFEVDEIQLDEKLYGGGARSYLAALNALEVPCQQLALVGHNPDISFLAEYLTRADMGIGNGMDKAGVIILEFENLKWSEISSKDGKFIAYHSPVSIANE